MPRRASCSGSCRATRSPSVCCSSRRAGSATCAAAARCSSSRSRLFTLASAACGAAPNSSSGSCSPASCRAWPAARSPRRSARRSRRCSAARSAARRSATSARRSGCRTAIGPLLGGLLIAAFGDTEGWRAVFYVNVPIGLVAMPLAWKLLPAATTTRCDASTTSTRSASCCSASAPCCCCCRSCRSASGAAWKWLLVPVAVVVLARVRALGPALRAPREGTAASTSSCSTGAPTPSASSLITIYFAGFTPLFFVFTLFLQTGLQLQGAAAGLADHSVRARLRRRRGLGGRIVDATSGGRWCRWASCSSSSGSSGRSSPCISCPTRHRAGPPSLPLARRRGRRRSGDRAEPDADAAEVPVEQAGTAGGLLQTGQRVGAAVGIAAVGSAFFATARADRAATTPTPYERGILITLCFVVARAADRSWRISLHRPATVAAPGITVSTKSQRVPTAA